MVFPVLIAFSVTAILGLILGVLYLRGQRKPALIGVHILVGMGVLEGTTMLLHGTPNGQVINAGSFGTVILVLLVAVMLSGLGAALARKERKLSESLLVGHAGTGLVVFALFCVMISQV